VPCRYHRLIDHHYDAANVDIGPSQRARHTSAHPGGSDNASESADPFVLSCRSTQERLHRCQFGGPHVVWSLIDRPGGKLGLGNGAWEGPAAPLTSQLAHCEHRSNSVARTGRKQ